MEMSLCYLTPQIKCAQLRLATAVRIAALIAIRIAALAVHCYMNIASNILCILYSLNSLLFVQPSFTIQSSHGIRCCSYSHPSLAASIHCCSYSHPSLQQHAFIAIRITLQRWSSQHSLLFVQPSTLHRYSSQRSLLHGCINDTCIYYIYLPLKKSIDPHKFALSFSYACYMQMMH